MTDSMHELIECARLAARSAANHDLLNALANALEGACADGELAQIIAAMNENAADGDYPAPDVTPSDQ